MKLGLIGVGQAGGKIADQFQMYDKETEIGCVVDAMAVNSSKPDLIGLSGLPSERRVLIGQNAVGGHGVGTDNEKGAKITHNDIKKILYRLEEMPLGEIDAFLVMAGLGGGMGSGGAPVISKYLRQRYDFPVYAVGFLPSSNEGRLYEYNTMTSIRTLVHSAENIILFDNEQWSVEDAPVEESYFEMNDQLIIRLEAVFGSTEPLSSGDDVGSKVMDAEDLKNTFREGDVSVIGYSDMELDIEKSSGGFLSSIFGGDDDEIEDTSEQVKTVIQQATLGKLTAKSNLEGTDSVLGMVAGDSDLISQKGLDLASDWLNEETKSKNLRMGDYPVHDDEDDEYIAGIVVLSGPPSIKRIVFIYNSVVGLDEFDETDADDIMERFLYGDEGPSALF